MSRVSEAETTALDAQRQRQSDEGRRDGLVRYRFFDDPDHNGHDAVYGLRGPLHDLVNALKSAAYEYGAAWSYDNTRLYFRYESGPTSEPRYLTSLGNGTFSALSTPATELPGDGSSWTFSKDGLEVFYTTAPAVGEYDLHRATRPDLTSSFTIDDGPIQKLQRASGSEGWPTLDAPAVDAQ